MLLAEWTKIRTVRSSFWTLLATFVVCAGLAYLVGLGFKGMDREFDPLFPTFYSLTLGQLPLVVFGVTVVSSEYSTGNIRSSLAAVPRRGAFYAAKIGVLALVAAVASLVTVTATFFAAQWALGPHRAAFDAQAFTGATLYLTLMCLFAAGVAAMLRSAAFSLAILMPLLFLGSQGLGNIPKVKEVAQYLPDQAGWVIMHLTGPDGNPFFGRDYGPWTGLGITALWALAALSGGYTLLRRRDA
jgi:ABC-2 type transport system permease protein